jgi:hypothetical protein
MIESIDRHERHLSVRELERLIFLTFMHSQGSPELQELLNEWIVSVYGKQNEERVCAAFENFLNTQFESTNKDSLLRLSESGRHTAATRTQATNEVSFLSHLYKIPNETWNTEQFLQTVFNFIIERDRVYIYNEGRPNRAIAGSSSLADAYFSFVKTYINELKPTGDEALDQLYRTLHGWVVGKPEEDEILDLIHVQQRMSTTS